MPWFPATCICITAHCAANSYAMGDTAPQTVHQPLSQLEFQARSFGQIPKSHQLMESLLLLFVMGSRVIHFVITIHLANSDHITLYKNVCEWLKLL